MGERIGAIAPRSRSSRGFYEKWNPRPPFSDRLANVEAVTPHPMQPIIWAASERYGIEKLVPYWLEFLDVAQRDIREKLPLHCEQATAIKVLGVRK